MALSCYCKKCKMDVPAGQVCAACGSPLAPSSRRSAWCVDHHPVRDWMCWNAAMRIILPVMFLVLFLVLTLETLTGGTPAVEALLRGSFLLTMLAILLVVCFLVYLLFLLQGSDVLDCVVDSRGCHVRVFLPSPTPLKLLCRLRSPSLMEKCADDMVELALFEIPWSQVRRVQLWPEKTMVLLYAPAWWLRLPLPCTPFTYPDVLEMIREKLGRKKKVRKPGELTATEKKEPRRSRRAPQASQASQVSPDMLEKIRQMNAYDESRSE